jgi:ribonuclease VapC
VAETLHVLDASAILAWLKQEPGWEKVSAAMDARFVVSAANHAEVVGKLVDEKVSREDIALMLEEFVAELVPVDHAIAELAGHLRGPTRDRGLSLGDRLCLATAQSFAKDTAAAVLTADRNWSSLKLPGVHVSLIR